MDIGPLMDKNDFFNLEGEWTYRSYHNNPDPSTDDRWGIYTLTLKQDKDGNLEGKLDSGDPEEVYVIRGRINKDGTRNDTTKDKCFSISMIASGATDLTKGHEYR